MGLFFAFMVVAWFALNIAANRNAQRKFFYETIQLILFCIVFSSIWVNSRPALTIFAWFADVETSSALFTLEVFCLTLVLVAVVVWHLWIRYSEEVDEKL